MFLEIGPWGGGVMQSVQGDTQITTPTPTFVKSLSHLSKLLAIYMKNSKK